MFNKRNNLFKRGLLTISMLLMSAGLMLTGCGTKTQGSEGNPSKGDEKKISIVATTNIAGDLAMNIAGDKANVISLMGPGIDPHLYQASAGDVTKLQEADMVVYNGFHLEGKMGEIFEQLKSKGSGVICIENGIPKDMLLTWDGGGSVHDPHIWFDVNIWKHAAIEVEKGLSEKYPDDSKIFKANLDKYLIDLDKLDKYIDSKVKELPEKQRVLITAHDAFSYFGKAYKFQVKGLQGISTEAEAGTGDVSKLAQFIVDNKIKAIFVESSVPKKNVEALQAAVKAKGFDVKIGGELYSDSLGDKEHNTETYIKTLTANIDTIVNALK